MNVFHSTKSDVTDKDTIVKMLSDLPLSVLQLALMYARYLTDYGEDVTKIWLTATQNSAALESAYRKGFYDGARYATGELDES